MSVCMDVERPETFINICSKSFVSRWIDIAINDYANVEILKKKVKKRNIRKNSQRMKYMIETERSLLSMIDVTIHI